MIQYGFERLVLLGSAGYQRAELPLDAAVSLIAPNNTGKTSLINALQFLLIIDQRRMDFGAHDLEKSKRFYFPNNSAYILLEVCQKRGPWCWDVSARGLAMTISTLPTRERWIWMIIGWTAALWWRSPNW